MTRILPGERLPIYIDRLKRVGLFVVKVILVGAASGGGLILLGGPIKHEAARQAEEQLPYEAWNSRIREIGKLKDGDSLMVIDGKNRQVSDSEAVKLFGLATAGEGQTDGQYHTPLVIVETDALQTGGIDRIVMTGRRINIQDTAQLNKRDVERLATAAFIASEHAEGAPYEELLDLDAYLGDSAAETNPDLLQFAGIAARVRGMETEIPVYRFTFPGSDLTYAVSLLHVGQ